MMMMASSCVWPSSPSSPRRPLLVHGCRAWQAEDPARELPSKQQQVGERGRLGRFQSQAASLSCNLVAAIRLPGGESSGICGASASEVRRGKWFSFCSACRRVVVGLYGASRLRGARVRERDAWVCGCVAGSQTHENLERVAGRESKEKDSGWKRLFLALRLRGRARIVVRIVRKWVPKLSIDGCLRWVQGHLKQLVLCSLVGCAIVGGSLFLKFTAVPAARVMPYSELVSHLHAKTVTNALFEEGSRQIFFNVRSEDPNTIGEMSSNDASFTGERSQANYGVDELTKSGGMERSSDVSLNKNSRNTEQSFKWHAQHWQYSSRRIENDETYLLTLMRESGVTYNSAPQPMSAALRNVLITIVGLWIPLSPLLWLMHRQLSGGSVSARKRRPSTLSVKFEDVAGVDDAKTELMEVVSCFRCMENFRKLGAKLPKGVLLIGPPGTGKTLLARAVAGEAVVPFFAASASEFVEMFVGRGAARIRELFTAARKCESSIIFIDELDAIGGRRGRSFNDERDQTLNQLLTEMDGFESDTGVLIIGATNRPEVLDPALCRQGRFSRKVLVTEPDLNGRQQILAVHMRGVTVEGDKGVICNIIASITWGFVGADLAGVVNEAALLAVRQGRSAVTLQDFMEAVSRIKYGIGKKPAFTAVLEKNLKWWFNWIPSKLFMPLQKNNPPSSLGYLTAPLGS
eukprot:c28015_g1_i1 orf=105-2171(+)